jgi:hypothetical protein
MQVGWDWASETHDISVIDDRGQVVDRWSLAHDEAGIDQAIGRLASHGQPSSCRSRSSATAGWWSTGCWLLATGRAHPSQRLQRHPAALGCRPGQVRPRRQLQAGRLVAHRQPTGCAPLDAATRHLQLISRLRDDHIEAKTAATNQLGALLDGHWPGAKAIFARLDSQIAAGLPGALSHTPGGPAARRGPPGQLPAPPLLQRPAQPSRAAGPSARRSRGDRHPGP